MRKWQLLSSLTISAFYLVFGPYRFNGIIVMFRFNCNIQVFISSSLYFFFFSLLFLFALFWVWVNLILLMFYFIFSTEFVYACISLLGLLNQSATSWVAQTTEIVSIWVVPSKGCKRELVPGPFPWLLVVCWRSLVSLACWNITPSLPSFSQVLLPVCLFPNFPFYKDTLYWIRYSTHSTPVKTHFN